MLLDADAEACTVTTVQPLPGYFLRVIQESLTIRSHSGLLAWLQGGVQTLLPHEILLVAWGDPLLDSFRIDVTSRLADVRTQDVDESVVQPLVKAVSDAWTAARHVPCLVHVQPAAEQAVAEAELPSEPGFACMRHALVHGIRNQRDDQLCLYVLLRTTPFPSSARGHLEILLPHMDAALRQIDHLPTQRGAVRDAAPLSGLDELEISTREADILRWVAAGKTNEEIGLIMGISPFTVKNHLQRIFRKLGVSNRAQAVQRILRHEQHSGDLRQLRQG